MRTDLKPFTCCFTGHRNLKHSKERIKEVLKNTIIQLIKKGIIYYGCGGALGFDTIAATTILELKKEYPQIKLILVLPCRNQADKWSDKDIEEYERIKEQADKIRILSETYTNTCMHERNRHLINNSKYCIAYLTENYGGTFYTVNYAKKRNINVINIADYL